MLPKMKAQMRAVPRSGCARMRPIGSARMSPGTTRSFSVRPSLFGSWCRYFASAMMRPIFISSLGWSEKLPMGIQRIEPRMFLPIRKTSTSSTTPAP